MERTKCPCCGVPLDVEYEVGVGIKLIVPSNRIEEQINCLQNELFYKQLQLQQCTSLADIQKYCLSNISSQINVKARNEK